MILPLLYYGNAQLRKKCLPVKEITADVRALVANMIETMDGHNGVGLAAIQVGVLLQILVIRPEIVGPDGEFALGDPEVYINTVLTSPAVATDVMNEGCLSLPQIRADVERPTSIHLEALNLEGKRISLTLSGFKARQIMHEHDHLHGTLFIDRASKEERKKIEPKLRELKKKYSNQ
jgi:peptide deformylase